MAEPSDCSRRHRPDHPTTAERRVQERHACGAAPRPVAHCRAIDRDVVGAASRGEEDHAEHDRRQCRQRSHQGQAGDHDRGRQADPPPGPQPVELTARDQHRGKRDGEPGSENRAERSARQLVVPRQVGKRRLPGSPDHAECAERHGERRGAHRCIVSDSARTRIGADARPTSASTRWSPTSSPSCATSEPSRSSSASSCAS